MKLKQNKQSKLVVALSAVILLLVALSATLTFAYFTATTGEKSSGSIDFGNLTLTAGNDGVSFSSDNQNGVKFQPGDTITVKGKTVLSSNIDAYYRVKMDVAIYTKDNSGNKNSSAMTICNSTETDHVHGKNCLTASELTLIKNTFFKKMKADGTVSQTDSENTKGLQISLTELSEHNGYYYGLKTKNAQGGYDDLKIFDYTSDGTTDNGVTITLDATKFGNWWQDKIVVITVQVEAIQALHLQKTSGGSTINLTEGTAKQIGTADGNIRVEDLANAEAWNTIANDGVVQNSGN